MFGGLKKAIRKNKKGLLNLGKRVAPVLLAAAPVAGAIMRGKQALKSLGVNPKGAKLGKVEPASVNVAIAKPAVVPISARQSSRRGAFTEDYAGSKKLRSAHSTQSPAVARALAARRKAKRVTGKGRRPPSGGLDLKALSASWRAAGKPGTWQGWIKANHGR